jgi:hypothetical protein
VLGAAGGIALRAEEDDPVEGEAGFLRGGDGRG